MRPGSKPLHLTPKQRRVDSERRHDPAAIAKIIEVASRLQLEHRSMISVGDIETIGAELGIEPQFVQRALDTLAEAKRQRYVRNRKIIAAAWWAMGWILAFVTAAFGSWLLDPTSPDNPDARPGLIIFFVLGCVAYVRVGKHLTRLGWHATLEAAFCSGCGEHLPAGAMFCPKCGAKAP